MSGLPTIFIKEEETHTSGTLKLVVEPACIFMGKLIYNFFLLLCLEMIIIPLFLILMDLQIINLINFTVITLLATLGLSLGGTFIAAIISKASSRNTLFSILSLPILLPVLITGINGTKITLHESQFITINEELKILLAYDIIVTTASFMLFDFIWEE
jgi:heme exporter protein B